MSDLQIGLIALGILLILVVLGLNWWQDRRVRRRMQENFPPSREDPLLGENEQSAPASAPAAAVRKPAVKRPVEPTPAPERREPALNTAAAAQAGSGAGRAAARRSGNDAEAPDMACEAVIDIAFPEPVPAQELAQAADGLRATGKKPVRTFYRTAGGMHCATLREDEDYAAMQVAVLLANRSGPLTATEWAQAWAGAQQVADRFDGRIEGPDHREVVDRAGQLDEICASLDTSVGLTLVPQSPQPWRVAEVLSAARKAGFVENAAAETLEWLDDNAAVRFTLTHPAAAGNGSGAAVGRLSLVLDVPRSPASATAFADMAAVARQLATVLDAGVVDDNGLPLVDGSESMVDAQLGRMYAQLAETGLPAGSARSLRVFS